MPSSKSSKPGGIKRDHAPFVGNGPGAIALNRMLCLPHSTASDLVIANTPAFAAAEGTTYGDPVHAYVVTMLRTFPFLFLIISFPIVLVQFQVPIKTISITTLKALGLSISVGEIKFPAALFKRQSMVPNLSSV